MSDSFVHLHVHTEYSMLDGAARLKELFAEAARQEMPALAMTDHGNIFGAYDFYAKATAAGVKPIIGMEAYLTPNTSRYERTRVRWASSHYVIALAGSAALMVLAGLSIAGLTWPGRRGKGGNQRAGRNNPRGRPLCRSEGQPHRQTRQREDPRASRCWVRRRRVPGSGNCHLPCPA